MPIQHQGKSPEQQITEAQRFVKRLPALVAREAVNFVKDRFRFGGWAGISFQRWKPRKTNKGRPRALLIQTGRLRNSVHASQITGRSITITASMPYASAHNEGFSGQVSQNVKAHRRWYEQNVKDESIKDYAGRSITFSRKTLESHLQEIYTTQNRHDFTQLIGQILSEPDEVWFKHDHKLVYHFLKFTKKFPVKVFCRLEGNGELRLASWHPLDKKTAEVIDKNERNGILIKKKR